MKNTSKKRGSDSRNKTTVINGLKTKGLAWFKPWSDKYGNPQAPINIHSKKNYRGFNAFLLNAICTNKEYKTNYWCTYKQCTELGGQVIKGSKSTEVYYWNISFKHKETGKYYKNETELKKAGFYKGHKDIKTNFVLKYYNVFNIDQCENLEAPAPAKTETKKPKLKPIKKAEKLISNFKNMVTLKHIDNRAYYSPSLDYINMPINTISRNST
jgi:antirestriction protein ArdC